MMTWSSDKVAIDKLIAPQKTNRVAITLRFFAPKIVHKKSTSPTSTIKVSILMSFSMFDQSGGQKK